MLTTPKYSWLSKTNVVFIFRSQFNKSLDRLWLGLAPGLWFWADNSLLLVYQEPDTAPLVTTDRIRRVQAKLNKTTDASTCIVC